MKNRRNGKTGKSVRSRFGELEIQTPRDRSGTYEPLLVGKHKRKLGNSVEQKILSLYSMGMSYRQIQSHLQEMYSVDLSEAQLTNITDKILPVIEEWRNRPLEGECSDLRSLSTPKHIFSLTMKMSPPIIFFSKMLPLEDSRRRTRSAKNSL